MKTMKLFLAAAFLLCASQALMAQTIVKADLDGGEEVPPVASNGSGLFLCFVFPDRIEFSLTARNLGTEVQMAHIHLGFPGVNGPVIFPLYSKAKNGAFTGRVEGVLTAADLVANADRGVPTFEAARSAISGGRTYANLHTTLAGGGEIRGQIKVYGQ